MELPTLQLSPGRALIYAPTPIIFASLCDAQIHATFDQRPSTSAQRRARSARRAARDEPRRYARSCAVQTPSHRVARRALRARSSVDGRLSSVDSRVNRDSWHRGAPRWARRAWRATRGAPRETRPDDTSRLCAVQTPSHRGARPIVCRWSFVVSRQSCESRLMLRDAQIQATSTFDQRPSTSDPRSARGARRRARYAKRAQSFVDCRPATLDRRRARGAGRDTRGAPRATKPDDPARSRANKTSDSPAARRAAV